MCKDFIHDKTDCIYSNAKCKDVQCRETILDLPDIFELFDEPVFEEQTEVEMIEKIKTPMKDEKPAMEAKPNGMPMKETMDCNTCVMNEIGLAQAYVPYQMDGTPMGLEQSLVCGTAFEGLVHPYMQGMHLKRYQRRD